MAEIEIGGVAYRTGKLDAMTQFHVARRLAPVMAALAGAFGALGAFTGASPAAEVEEDGHEPADKAPEQPKADVFSALEPLADALSKMRDADAEYVVNSCLKTCGRSNGQDRGYSPVMAANGRMMFDDLDMAVMLQLVWAVIEGNLAGFFGASPSMSGVLGLLRRKA